MKVKAHAANTAWALSFYIYSILLLRHGLDLPPPHKKRNGTRSSVLNTITPSNNFSVYALGFSSGLRPTNKLTVSGVTRPKTSFSILFEKHRRIYNQIRSTS